MTPEGIVRNQVCSYLWRQGLFFWVHDSMGIYDAKKKIYRMNKSPWRIKGVSDILGILPDGRLFAIELKSAKGRLTPEQKIFIEQIKKRGGIAFMAKSIADVQENLNEFIKVK